MGKAHDKVVSKLYDEYHSDLDESRWDQVYREVTYYHRPSNPDVDPEYYGHQKGEMDVFLIDEVDKTIKYVEVKTNPNDIPYAQDQLERAEDHWESLGWDFIGEVYLEGGDSFRHL